MLPGFLPSACNQRVGREQGRSIRFRREPQTASRDPVDGKRGVGHWPQATAPIFDSTVADIACFGALRFSNCRGSSQYCARPHTGWNRHAWRAERTPRFDPILTLGATKAVLLDNGIRAVVNFSTVADCIACEESTRTPGTSLPSHPRPTPSGNPTERRLERWRSRSSSRR